MLNKFLGRLFPRRIRDYGDLRRFLSGEASYVAQRSTYEFARNTLAWFGQSAFGDDKFNEVFAVCRWEAFAGIGADMTMVLRATLAAGPEADPALLRLYADALGEYPHPVHRPDGWSDCHASLLARFSGAPEGQAVDLTAFGRRTGALIHDKAPARSGSSEEERDVLAAAVTFGLISFQDRLPRRLDVATLKRHLATGSE